MPIHNITHLACVVVPWFNLFLNEEGIHYDPALMYRQYARRHWPAVSIDDELTNVIKLVIANKIE